MKIDWGTIEAEAREATGFPAHGWARTTFGAKVLWLPVKGTFTTWYWQERRGLPSGAPLDQAAIYFDAFYRTLYDLGVVLRELGRLRRLGSEMFMPLEEQQDQETFNKGLRVHELTRPALDLAYVYLRRLADRFAACARFLLFAHPRCASDKFTKLRAMIDNAEKLRSAGPLCDVDALCAIFKEHCSWFERLRGGPTEEHGLRDLLEHHSVRVEVSAGQTGEEPPYVSAYIFHSNPVRVGAELFDSLSEITAGLCGFWSHILPLMERRTTYERYDWLLLTGLDDDATAFWPQIGSTDGIAAARSL